ncbi:MAG: pantetheine-phosphate adenylyltransferase [Chloroflexi bacterium]|nr:pantetheine-phosphate adenylyltransferase [Chloroflexota bacterium]
MAKAVYPGSFDPVTLGHLDIAIRAAKIFDEVVVAVYDAPPKRLLFDTDERMRMWEECVRGEKNISVVSYKGLTVDLAHQMGASVLVRGLRALSDFEYELEMALTNKRMASDIEAVFLMSSNEYLYLSSSRIRELWGLGRSVQGMVPDHVDLALRQKLAGVT